jgi:hypothetical protein
MKIYSIKEIIIATNNFLDLNDKKKNKNNTLPSNKKISAIIKNKTKISSKSFTSEKKNNRKIETPLVLKNEIPANNEIDSFNYNIKIKPEIKDHMINELYYFLKKKIKKNTLKIIIDQQLELKNFKNKIIFLKHKEKKLKTNYNILKYNYELVLENYAVLKENNNNLQDNFDNIVENKNLLDAESKNLKLSLERLTKNNKILNIDNNNLRNNLDNLAENKNHLDLESKNLQLILEELKKDNKILNNDNVNLRNNFDQVSKVKEQLDIENNKFKINLDQQKTNLEESLMKNRSFEINNSELKKTISRYIINYKKLQEKTNLIENSKILKSEDDAQKVKFYQDENIRLSSELLSTRKKNETIKTNINNIELEKQKISNKIKELNNSIIGKSNIISSPISKEIPVEDQKEISKLNDTEQKSLDEVINRIFSKI